MSPFFPSLKDHCGLSSTSVTNAGFGLTDLGGAGAGKDGRVTASGLIDWGGAGAGKNGTDAALGLMELGAGEGGKHETTFPSNT